MADFDMAGEMGGGLLGSGEPEPDAETMLTPITRIGTTPRAQMVRKLADIVVLPAGRISSNERSLVADILLQIVDKVEVDLRIEVATRVARVPESPPALTRMLVLDEAPVAEKILRGAEMVPEALLIEAAREGESAHRLMIAKRIDLSTAVADALMQFDELDVFKAVLKREDCLLSPNAINKCVALSATHAEIQGPLLRRRELEPAHGFMMFWWVESEQRQRILSRFALDRQVIQDALADLYPKVFRSDHDPDPFVRDILLLAERRHRPRGANGEQVSLDVVIKTLAAARRYPSQEVIHAVGMVAGVSRDLAARILRDPTGEPFAVMCKGLSVPRDQFFALFAVESEEEGIGSDQAEYLLSVFDGLARDFSRAILRYWDWDSNPRIAYISRLLGLDDDFPIDQHAV